MDRGQIMTLRKENSTIRKQRAYGQTTHSKSWSWKEGRKWYWWHLWLTVGRHSYLGIFHFPSHFCDFPSMPVFSARKPHAWNIHINDCRVFVGFEDKNNQILPLQVSTESMELVCTYKYCHHSSRDICFGPVFIYLFPTIQSHLWFPSCSLDVSGTCVRKLRNFAHAGSPVICTASFLTSFVTLPKLTITPTYSSTLDSSSLLNISWPHNLIGYIWFLGLLVFCFLSVSTQQDINFRRAEFLVSFILCHNSVPSIVPGTWQKMLNKCLLRK